MENCYVVIFITRI